MKILLPVDGSEYTKRMLAYLAAHDELLGPGHEFVFLTATPPVPTHVARFLSRGDLDAYYGEQVERVLQPVRQFAAQVGWTARFTSAIDHPAEAIVAAAEAEKPALLVMGTHGHSALGNVLLGSVTTGVLARCRVPVLLIR